MHKSMPWSWRKKYNDNYSITMSELLHSASVKKLTFNSFVHIFFWTKLCHGTTSQYLLVLFMVSTFLLLCEGVFVLLSFPVSGKKSANSATHDATQENTLTDDNVKQKNTKSTQSATTGSFPKVKVSLFGVLQLTVILSSTHSFPWHHYICACSLTYLSVTGSQ